MAAVCIVRHHPSQCFFFHNPTLGLGGPSSSPKPPRRLTLTLTLTPITRRRKAMTMKSTMAAEKLEIFKSMEGWAEENILTLLKPVEKSWQPQDFLPDSSSSDEGFLEAVKEIKERAAVIPDEYYVCLAGNMITEEALPTYQTVINTLEETRDETGCSQTVWEKWIRGWSAEENRHGDLLNKYLYLTGRLDMRQIEKTIQYLLAAGVRTDTDKDPFLGAIYTSFQEKATAIAHGNTARHAKTYGDVTLARICRTIAADEKRHETGYTMFVGKLFDIDPETTMLALAKMMRRRITMPALLMFDGQDAGLFEHYSAVAERIGVYTSEDYVDIVEHLVRSWGVERVTAGLSGEGRQAQDYVCGLAERMRKLLAMQQERRSRRSDHHNKSSSSSEILLPFSWIFNRRVRV